MSLVLFPAVDVAGGLSVRPRQGQLVGDEPSGHPLEIARAFRADGAEWIHLVDLDAAYGRGSNAELLAAVVGELDVKVELAGGIRDDGSLRRALATGCERVVLSTAALADLPWCARVIAEHRERVAVGLDVRIVEGADGGVTHRLVARGSTDDVGELWETLELLDRSGASRYVVTDVSRDGMLDGPNLELLRQVLRATVAPLVASGGVASLADLEALHEPTADGARIEGAIVGKALYEGRFTLPEALRAVRTAG
ncbi:MAG: HisA/HisF-related TIM barrel protein [Ilumatobacteraceae bacterium]